MKTLFKSTLLIITIASCSAQGKGLIETHECILVEGAEIRASFPSAADDSEFNLHVANRGHYVLPGSKTVLLLRLFSEKPGVVDSQYFTKVTGYLNEGVDEGGVGLDGGHFSSGWSGFINMGDFWVSDEASIRAAPASEPGGLVRVSGVIVAKNSYRQEKKKFDLDFTCSIERRELSSLSAWEGAGSGGWNSFYPQAKGGD